MAKTINIEYTDPITGAEKTVQVTIDVDRYRKDSEEGPTENFFLKASATGASVINEEIDDLISDILDGKPSGHRSEVIQSLVDTAFTADGTTLSVTPEANTAGFLPNIPCVVMDKYGNVIDWFIPSGVSADFTIPAGPTGDAALHYDCEVGWIVQQAKYFYSPLGENSQLGIKAQLERPTTPTAVVVTGTGSPLSVAWTKPVGAVITHYDIYCIKADAEPTSIEPNSLPSVADRAAGLASSGVSVTQYFDQDDMELKNLVTGNYFIGVVAKDGSGMVEVNESAIGWSEVKAITI